jgi:hypothetical protein
VTKAQALTSTSLHLSSNGERSDLSLTFAVCMPSNLSMMNNVRTSIAS